MNSCDSVKQPIDGGEKLEYCIAKYLVTHYLFSQLSMGGWLIVKLRFEKVEQTITSQGYINVVELVLYYALYSLSQENKFTKIKYNYVVRNFYV